MRKTKSTKNRKKLTCQVLAALTAGLMLVNGTAFAETKEDSNHSVTASGDHTTEAPVYCGNVELVTDASGNVGIANGNNLTILDGTFYQLVLSGGNVVIGDSTPDPVAGKSVKPYTGSGQANNSILTVNNGLFTGSIYGGNVKVVGYSPADAAAANGNTVTIITADKIRGAVSGGNVQIKGGTAQADGNTVKITGGTFTSQSNSDITGGYAASVGDDDLNAKGGSAQANGNSVEISDIEIKINDTGTGDNDRYLTRSIYGGYATAESGPSAVANNNSVTINGGNIQLFPEGVDGFSASNIYAGYATNAETNTASNNTLTINGGEITCYNAGENCTTIGGGYANDGAIGNKVIISGGTIGDNDNNVHVYGGNSLNLAKGNEVRIAQEAGKTVTINGNVFGGYGDGSESRAIIEGNRVIFSAGTVSGKVAGASAQGLTTIKGNEVIVDGNVEGEVYGGFGATGAHEAIIDGNKVVITGGATFTGNVYGGYVDDEVDTIAKNNFVVVADGTVDGNVFAGGTWGGNEKANVFNNGVTLGTADGTGTAKITGEVLLNWFKNSEDISVEGAIEALPGGNLNVYNAGHTIDGNLYAEEAKINFYGDAEGTRLNVSGTAYINKANVKVNVRNIGEIEEGKSISLIGGGKVNGIAAYTITDGLVENIGTMADNGTITFNHANDKANEITKSPVETQIVGVALVNGAMDMMANQGFSEAAEAVNGSGDGDRSMAPFASIGGSSMRQNSGSYVDMNAWNVGIGFAKEVTNSQGKLMFAPIVEYGKGSYDSYLDNGTHGSGDSSFWGVGAMIKQENKDGFYYEGSLQAGRLKNDYKSSLLGGMNYDNSATFYALHAGAGKTVKLNEDDTMDCYGKIFYTRQGSSTATLSSGHVYGFDAINSVRTRLGFRYTHKIDKNQDVYAGLAWQHEFGSTANAVLSPGPYSISIPAPSVKGETGILELGMKVKSSNGKCEGNFGFIGSIGKQRGIGASAQFQWNF